MSIRFDQLRNRWLRGFAPSTFARLINYAFGLIGDVLADELAAKFDTLPSAITLWRGGIYGPRIKTQKRVVEFLARRIGKPTPLDGFGR